MHMGTMKFKQRGREEQAEADGVEVRVQTHTPHLPNHLSLMRTNSGGVNAAML
jgi:hypothetical protein